MSDPIWRFLGGIRTVTGSCHMLEVGSERLLVDLDVMIIESTYGNRNHEDLPGTEVRLARVINETCRRGGKVIIPAFSLGRTQELVKSIAQLMTDSRIPDIPVFADSPLVVNVSDVFGPCRSLRSDSLRPGSGPQTACRVSGTWRG